MLKQAIIATSFALGGAGIIFVGYLGTHPGAFTHPVEVLPSGPANQVAVVVPPAFQTASNVITLPEFLITGSGGRLKKHGDMAVKLDPCSHWSEVGAIFIDANGATGVREVRTLCAKPHD